MIQVEIADANESLASLVSAAERGDEVLLLRHGKTVARVVADRQHDRGRARAALDAMDVARRGNVLGANVTIRELIDEGRR